MTSSIPNHVAFIMDGNRRWAKQQGKLAQLGHAEGYKTANKVVRWCFERGVKYVTLYTFSTENWKRSALEVNFLIKMVKRIFQQDLVSLIEDNVRLDVIGDMSLVPQDVVQVINEGKEKTKHFTDRNVILAFSYGGRPEIINTAKRLLIERVDPATLDEALFSQYLYTAGIPDPDLLIRTGGNRRISNFLLWQLAYAELYFSDLLWPDLNEEELDKAFADFAERERRFGK